MRAVILSILAIYSITNPVMAEMETCKTIIQHSAASIENPWRTVNDGVMGGLSTGGSSLDKGVLTFTGITNTNGGGFSSVRMNVTRGAMADAKKLKVYMNRDTRSYSLTMRTDVKSYGRRIAFRGPIEEAPPGQWGYGSLYFDRLKASFRGRAVPEAIFDPAEVVELGLIIYDGKDGPFAMQLQRIEACW